MEHLSFFEYAGKRSSDFGIVISAVPDIPAAQRDIETVVIPGRDGVLTIDNGRFDEIQVVYSCWAYHCGRAEKAASLRRIKAWLGKNGGAYDRLADTYDPEYFWKAHFSGNLTIIEEAPNVTTFEAEFSAHPFKFSLEGEELREYQKTDTIFNPEAFPSDPYIRITGSGDMALAVNGQTWELKGVDGYIELDSMTKNTFKGSENWNAKKQGEGYPVFVPGGNSLEVTGNAAKIEIKPRWRTL